jgi:hypothetical protein
VDRRQRVSPAHVASQQESDWTLSICTYCFFCPFLAHISIGLCRFPERYAVFAVLDLGSPCLYGLQSHCHISRWAPAHNVCTDPDPLIVACLLQDVHSVHITSGTWCVLSMVACQQLGKGRSGPRDRKAASLMNVTPTISRSSMFLKCAMLVLINPGLDCVSAPRQHSSSSSVKAGQRQVSILTDTRRLLQRGLSLPPSCRIAWEQD